MRNLNLGRRRRGGATIPETALVLSGFLMFLMGIFEYSRYLMLLQVCNNAARDGARYACVNINQPATFNTTGANGLMSINDYVISQMGGTNTMIQSFAITVFPCNDSSLYSDPPVIVSKSGSPAWNQASFPGRIAVKITGNYVPILPVLVFFYTGGSNSVPINIAATSTSES